MYEVQVQNNEVGTDVARHVVGGGSVHDGRDPVAALFQVVGPGVQQVGFVFDNQNVSHTANGSRVWWKRDAVSRSKLWYSLPVGSRADIATATGRPVAQGKLHGERRSRWEPQGPVNKSGQAWFY